MLAGVRFVSQAELKELERKKAEEELERNRARAELEEEKQKKGRERKEERRRQEETGELTWLAPGVERRFGSSTVQKEKDARQDDSSSSDEDRRRSKKRRKEKHRQQEEASPSGDVDEDDHQKREKKRGRSQKGDRSEQERDLDSEPSAKGEPSAEHPPSARPTREDAGLDWMTRPALPGKPIASDSAPAAEGLRLEALDDATKLLGGETKPPSSSKELNPYWKGGGEGLPPDAEPQRGAVRQEVGSGIGDGGASWRLKALKRAQEAAAREGKNLNEVVQERWDSLGQLTASVASGRAAPAYAHRFAQKNRERKAGDGRPSDGEKEKVQNGEGQPSAESKEDGRSEEDKRPEGDKRSADHRSSGTPHRHRRLEGDKQPGEHRRSEAPQDRGYLRDVKSEKSQMRRPSEGASLSWRSRERVRPMRDADAAVMRGAAAAMNQFPNDGSFLAKFQKEAEQNAALEKEGRAAGAQGRKDEQEDREGVMGGKKREVQKERSVFDRIGNDGGAMARNALDEERDALRNMVAALGAPPETEPKESDRGPVSSSVGASEQLVADQPLSDTGPSRSTAPVEKGGGTLPGLSDKQPPGLSANQPSGLNANQLAAKAMRLKLMGKTAEAEELLKEAQKLRSVEVVTLPLVDAQGLAAPGAFGSAPVGGASERKPKRLQRYDPDDAKKTSDNPADNRPKVKPRFATETNEEESGSGSEEEKVPTGLGGLRSTGPQRARYYADDDEKDLKTLVSETKRGRGSDYDKYLAENIARDERFKGLADADAEYEHDDGLEMYESREKKGSQKKQAERFHSKQVADARRLQSQQDRCISCFDNPNKPKHLIVSIGVKVYVMLPPRGALVPGHCYIVPMTHEVASINLDEDVWDEVRNFKKCLIKMWASEGREVLFLETAVQLQRQKRHCMIEAVPVPAGVASRQAPLYFKKAIDEAESEWSQHNSKRIIDTRGKGLKASIPKNFPYFHVEFGLQGGYVHVIDDEPGWKMSFGRDVIAGMLRLPEEDRHGRPKQQTFEQQQKAVLDFSKKWEPHDWTKMLG